MGSVELAGQVCLGGLGGQLMRRKAVWPHYILLLDLSRDKDAGRLEGQGMSCFVDPVGYKTARTVQAFKSYPDEVGSGGGARNFLTLPINSE